MKGFPLFIILISKWMGVRLSDILLFENFIFNQIFFMKMKKRVLNKTKQK
jgi:hypothetical protein